MGKEENAKLQRTLAEERTREEYLRRENRELKVMLGTRQQRMEELRSRASRLLIEYYANKSEAGDPQAAAASLGRPHAECGGHSAWRSFRRAVRRRSRPFRGPGRFLGWPPRPGGHPPQTCWRSIR